MKYMLFEKPEEWQLIYCTFDHSDMFRDVEIARRIPNLHWEKFDMTRATSFDDREIKNDEKIFIIEDFDSKRSLWQIGSKVSDMNGTIIPHLYQVRRIGTIVES